MLRRRNVVAASFAACLCRPRRGGSSPRLLSLLPDSLQGWEKVVAAAVPGEHAPLAPPPPRAGGRGRLIVLVFFVSLVAFAGCPDFLATVVVVRSFLIHRRRFGLWR